MSIEYKYDQKIINYKFNKIHPILEIYRGMVIEKLFYNFYNLCKKYNKNIHKNKTDDFITRFCWSNLDIYDPALPFKKDHNYNYDQLYIDLKNYNISIEIMKELNIELFLKKKIKKLRQISKMINYDKSINIKVDDDKLIYKNKYWCSINKKILETFNKFYDGKYKNNKFALYFCILYRYNLLEADNQQLAINLNLKNDLTTYFGINIELFGSTINRFFNNFCSIFYDLEHHFGSLGNFFNITPKQGLYMANPPYDESLMENMAKHLIFALENTNLPLGFIITIPIWDYDTQKNINKKCNTKYSDMGIYKAYELLKNTRFYHKHYIFCKQDFKYHKIKENRDIAASNTYIFVIKNNNLEFNTLLFEKLLKNHKLYYLN